VFRFFNFELPGYELSFLTGKLPDAIARQAIKKERVRKAAHKPKKESLLLRFSFSL
jgi:hypothetical protein